MTQARTLRYVGICIGTAAAYFIGILAAIILIHLLAIPSTLSGQIFFFAHGFALLFTAVCVYFIWQRWPEKNTLYACGFGFLLFIAALLSVNVHFNQVDATASTQSLSAVASVVL